MKKEYILFAGVNGAGKTTFYKNNTSFKGQPRINSDEIVVQNGGDWRNPDDQARAMREAVNKLKEYFDGGISFNQESTLTGSSIINTIKRARECGYAVKMYYIGLASADLAIERVAKRVSMGGHGIEEQDIRRRYVNSLMNLAKAIPLCDTVIVLDNTVKHRQVAVFENGRLVESDIVDCEWVKGCLIDWLTLSYGEIGAERPMSSTMGFEETCAQIRKSCTQISYVKYWWSEDGEVEICKKGSEVLETEGQCSHCMKTLPEGEEYVTLVNHRSGEQYMICRECAEKSCVDLM